MVDVAALLPIGGIAGFLAIFVNAIVAWIVLMVVDKIISGNLDVKRSFIMALVALFIVPIAVGFAGLPGIISIYIIPLVVWIILGELLLKATMVQKLKIVVIAFVVYVVLNMIGVPGMISMLLPF